MYRKCTCKIPQDHYSSEEHKERQTGYIHCPLFSATPPPNSPSVMSWSLLYSYSQKCQTLSSKPVQDYKVECSMILWHSESITPPCPSPASECIFVQLSSYLAWAIFTFFLFNYCTSEGGNKSVRSTVQKKDKAVYIMLDKDCT